MMNNSKVSILWDGVDCTNGNLTIENFNQVLPFVGQSIDITDKEFNLILLVTLDDADITDNTLTVKVKRIIDYSDGTHWLVFVCLFMLGFICRGFV